RSMGSIVLGDRRLDTLPAICAICQSLYKNPELDTMLKSSELWILAQRRNLIVHRRGMVDDLYRSKTPDKAPIGQPVVISAHDIDAYLCKVRDIGLLMAQSASHLINAPSEQ